MVLRAMAMQPRARKGTASTVHAVAVGSTLNMILVATIASTAETRKNAQQPMTELRRDAGADSLIIKVVVTGGSDYHGENKTVPLGCLDADGNSVTSESLSICDILVF